MMHALIAEDDVHTRDGLAEVLRAEGYDVTTAADGEETLRQFHACRPDFVCLDIMMPEQSGFEVCRRLRELVPDLPIIFISAKSEEADKLAGFDLGADDFIGKPFSTREVVARIRAVTRRCYARRPHPSPPFVMGDLRVYPAELRARRGDQTIELSLRDVKLLRLFHSHAGQALDRHSLVAHAWGETYLPNSRTLDQHISQLRKRIEVNAKTPRLIRTVHGVGYRYDG